jgi:hypothetical protein
MRARSLVLLAILVPAGASAYYFFLYLTRWEWNRALVSGVIFVAAEVAFVGALLLDRVNRLRDEVRALGEPPREPRPEILERIHEAAPEARDPFAWLSPRSGQTGVFIPVLLGAGVVVSGVAWVVERLARALTGPQFERTLALDLEVIALPSEPLYEQAPPGARAFHPSRR